MAYQVLIAESAIEDLRELVEFIAQDDPIAAERLGNKLLNHALSPASFPKRRPHPPNREISDPALLALTAPERP